MRRSDSATLGLRSREGHENGVTSAVAVDTATVTLREDTGLCVLLENLRCMRTSTMHLTFSSGRVNRMTPLHQLLVSPPIPHGPFETPHRRAVMRHTTTLEGVGNPYFFLWQNDKQVRYYLITFYCSATN